MRKTSTSTSYNRTFVRLSVPVDVPTHAKLRAISSLRGVDASALAASFIKAALASVVVRDVPSAELGGAGQGGSESRNPGSDILQSGDQRVF